MPRPAIDLLNSEPAYYVQIANDRWEGGGHHPRSPSHPEFYDPDATVAELEAKGLDAAVVSTLPPLFYTDLDLAPLEDMCNRTYQGWPSSRRRTPIASGGSRTSRSATLSVPPSCSRRRWTQGRFGVEIPSRVGPRRLDEPDSESF